MKEKLSRRKFIKLSMVSGVGLASLMAVSTSAGQNTNDLEVVHVPINIPDLPPEFEEYRIGFVSDLHLSPCGTESLIEQTMEALNTEQLDMVLLGGDFIWIEESFLGQSLLALQGKPLCFSMDSKSKALADKLYERVSRLVRELKSKDGVFAVYGNHDRWVLPNACKTRFSEARIPVLVNEVIPIHRGNARLLLIGLDDYWTGIPKFPNLPAIKMGREVRVLCTHNPDLYSQLLLHPTFEFHLGLAGHTHGGQIKLPGIGALSYNIEDLRFAEGLHQDRKASIYTNRGIGVVGIPIRVNCRPEATIVSLRRA